MLAQRNATLERLLLLRASNDRQHALAGAAANAAPTEQATSELTCGTLGSVCFYASYHHTWLQIVLPCQVPLSYVDRHPQIGT